MDLIQLSRTILLAAKLGQGLQTYKLQISEIDTEQLKLNLPNDDCKKAFWLNIYNAFLVEELSTKEKTKGFFSNPFIKFNNLVLSFDDIEHGILRKSKIKLGLGYVQKWKIADWEYLLRVEELDFRIHFALNCGANSCPPITVYNAEEVNSQLSNNTKNYLQDASVFSTSTSDKIKIPRLFLWYFADFGGFKGIKKLYRKYNLVPIDTEPKFSFLSYDWTKNIDNFTADYK